MYSEKNVQVIKSDHQIIAKIHQTKISSIQTAKIPPFGIMWSEFRALLKALEHHGSIVPRGLRGPSFERPLCREPLKRPIEIIAVRNTGARDIEGRPSPMQCTYDISCRVKLYRICFVIALFELFHSKRNSIWC